MSGIERDATDFDLFGPNADASLQIFRATVGHDGTDSVIDLGDGGTGNDDDGVSLLRVTLYQGKAVTDRAKPNVAQGHKVLVALPEGMFRIPPRGSQCVVCFPDGVEGVGVFLQAIARPNKNSGVYKNLKEGEACIYAGDADGSNPARVVLKKASRALVLMTEDADGNSVFLRMDGTKLQFVAPWGSLLFDVSGFHIRAGGAKFDMGGASGAVFDAIGGSATGMGTYITLTAANIAASGYCMLGIPSVPGTYYQAGMMPLPAPPPSGLIPVPLVPPLAPVLFFSPSVRLAT